MAFLADVVYQRFTRNNLKFEIKNLKLTGRGDSTLRSKGKTQVSIELSPPSIWALSTLLFEDDNEDEEDYEAPC